MSIRKFLIVVEGIAHEVEVEELGTTGVSSAPVAAPAITPVAAAPVVSATPAVPQAAPKASVPASGGIKAPLPGTVLNIPVSVGQAVKAGDVLIIIEAMKMENEIVAPTDGTVSSIAVQKGTAVEANDLLLTLQ